VESRARARPQLRLRRELSGGLGADPEPAAAFPPAPPEPPRSPRRTPRGMLAAREADGAVSVDAISDSGERPTSCSSRAILVRSAQHGRRSARPRCEYGLGTAREGTAGNRRVHCDAAAVNTNGGAGGPLRSGMSRMSHAPTGAGQRPHPPQRGRDDGGGGTPARQNARADEGIAGGPPRPAANKHADTSGVSSRPSQPAARPASVPGSQRSGMHHHKETKSCQSGGRLDVVGGDPGARGVTLTQPIATWPRRAAYAPGLRLRPPAPGRCRSGAVRAWMSPCHAAAGPGVSAACSQVRRPGGRQPSSRGITGYHSRPPQGRGATGVAPGIGRRGCDDAGRNDGSLPQ